MLCRPLAGSPVTIKRATRLADGALYLDVWVRDQCYGWVPAQEVANYPAWRDDIAPGGW